MTSTKVPGKNLTTTGWGAKVPFYGWNFDDFSPFKILGGSRLKKRNIVVGIPTVSRNKAYYLIDTVSSLVNNILSSDHDKVVIVILLADFNRIYRDKVVTDISKTFPSAVAKDLIQVIVPNEQFYPNLNDDLAQ